MATLPVGFEPLPESTLSIGCSSAIGRDRLGAELVAFGAWRPDILVGVHEMGRASLLAALRSGEIALGLLPGDPDPGFRSVRLWEDRALLALPRDNPLAGRTAVDPAEAQGLLFLASRRSAGCEVHRFLTRRLFGEDAHLSSDMRDCGLGRILQMVAQGQGAALLCDSHDYPARAELAAVPIAHTRACFGVHAQWADDRCDPALTALLRQLAPGAPAGRSPLIQASPPTAPFL